MPETSSFNFREWLVPPVLLPIFPRTAHCRGDDVPGVAESRIRTANELASVCYSAFALGRADRIDHFRCDARSQRLVTRLPKVKAAAGGQRRPKRITRRGRVSATMASELAEGR